MKVAPLLALLCFASALSLQRLSAQSLKSTLGDIPTAPVPVDSNGNPIPPTQPTDEQIAEQKRQQQARQDQIRAQEEKDAAEQRLRDEQLAAEHRAEERDAQNQNRTLIYVVLAVIATLIASRLFKKQPPPSP